MNHIIELSDYQVANLRQVLKAIYKTGWKGNPFAALNNGDWNYEVLAKLQDLDTGLHTGNRSAEEMVEQQRTSNLR